MRLVVLDGHVLNPGDNSWEPLAEIGSLQVYDRTPPDLGADRAREADILINGKVRIGSAELDAMPSVRCIGMMSTGYDVVDIREAGRRGIPVINVEAYAADAVAQQALALLMELDLAVGVRGVEALGADLAALGVHILAIRGCHPEFRSL